MQPPDTRPVRSLNPFMGEAFSLIERNIATSVESERKARFSTLAALGQDTFGGLAGRIGLETFAAYSLPETRVKSYINQAYQQAIDQYNFVIRREDKDRIALTFASLTGDLQKFDPLVPYCIPVEPIRLLVVSLIMLDAGQDGTALKTQAFDLIERNVVAAVERDRKEVFQTFATPENQNTFAGIVGRVGLETLKAYSMPPARVASYVNQAAAMAVDHFNFLTRREENELPSMEWLPRLTPDDDSEIATPLVTAEVVRMLAVSSIVLDAGQDGSGMKTQAFDLIERNVIASVELARRGATGEVGRLHNELTTGLKVPSARLTKLLNQAVSEVISHQNFLARADDDDIPSPPITYEQKRLLVESYLAALAGNAEASLGLKKAALDLVERDRVANDETVRRLLRTELSLGSPKSFGYCWARIGLGFDGSLTFSNNAMKRAVTSAEESLMNSGKWVGTVADYSFTLETSAEVFLPREVETVLFVTFDGDPRPVHDRFAEYMRGGTGIKTTEEPWRSGFSDRGDAVDPADGITKRKYFVSVPQENKQTLVRYLAKRRFVPHLADTEPMYLNNYEAVSQAALAIMTQGKAGSFDAARKLLADQMTQQYFKSQVFGIHNRSIIAMR